MRNPRQVRSEFRCEVRCLSSDAEQRISPFRDGLPVPASLLFLDFCIYLLCCANGIFDFASCQIVALLEQVGNLCEGVSRRSDMSDALRCSAHRDGLIYRAVKNLRKTA